MTKQVPIMLIGGGYGDGQHLLINEGLTVVEIPEPLSEVKGWSEFTSSYDAALTVHRYNVKVMHDEERVRYLVGHWDQDQMSVTRRLLFNYKGK